MVDFPLFQGPLPGSTIYLGQTFLRCQKTSYFSDSVEQNDYSPTVVAYPTRKVS
jgi:hypothetical protein